MDQPHSQNVYEGYLFFKADPLPGHRPTWYRVERSRIDFTQVELYRMIYTRAFKISAAKQYEALSTELHLQVNQLIHERRQQDRCVEWSCAYAEEHKGVAGGRDTISHGPETIAMTVILICRPSATKTHRRTPMGDLVDLSMLRHHNEQDHYVGLTTASGSPAELQTLYHDIAMRNTHQNPIPPPTQEKASRNCLERALFGHHSRTMNRSALLNGTSVRVNFEEDDESEGGSEKTESEEERNYECDEMQRAKTVHDRVDIGFLGGKPASQKKRFNHNPCRIGPRTTRAYGNPDRKWPKACQVDSKARRRRLQKVLEGATEAPSSMIRGQRRRNSC